MSEALYPTYRSNVRSRVEVNDAMTALLVRARFDTGSNVLRATAEEARKIGIPIHVLLQWDDEGNDRQAALDLFDAFASPERTLVANVGAHTGEPAFAGEGAGRFLVRHRQRIRSVEAPRRATCAHGACRRVAGGMRPSMGPRPHRPREWRGCTRSRWRELTSRAVYRESMW
ncbi:hypothetical protein CHE218_21320 [Microbacterium sp. che218]